MLRSVAAAIVLAVATLAAPPASACGESLFRIGKGVAYREYTAPLPGRILIVARTDGELALVERLAAAGHDVQAVADAGAVRTALAAGRFDIVMSLFAERDVVQAAMDGTAGAVYLPVARADAAAERRAARAVNRNAPTTEDGVKSFLQAIHRTLKARQA